MVPGVPCYRALPWHRCTEKKNSTHWCLLLLHSIAGSVLGTSLQSTTNNPQKFVYENWGRAEGGRIIRTTIFFKKKLGNNKTEEVDLAAQMKPYEGRRERETVV
jgi:hypothetical protein